MSHHGPRHPFKDDGLVVDSLTGFYNTMVKMPLSCRQELHKQGIYVSLRVKLDSNLVFRKLTSFFEYEMPYEKGS
jgi:hypothetical protein